MPDAPVVPAPRPRMPLLLLRLLSIGACLLALGCASPRAPPPSAGYGTSPLTSEESNSVAIHALGLVGTPYRYGGNTPEGGFDCSGLIGYVYKNSAGQATPRTVARMAAFGRLQQLAAHGRTIERRRDPCAGPGRHAVPLRW